VLTTVNRYVDGKKAVVGEFAEAVFPLRKQRKALEDEDPFAYIDSVCG